MFSFSYFGFDKSFYDVIKQCFTTFSDAPLLRSIVSSMAHTEAYELQFHRGSIIFSLCVSLGRTLPFRFFFSNFFFRWCCCWCCCYYYYFGKRIQNSPANARATLFSTNVHWSRQCVMCRCEVRRMPDYRFRYPATKEKSLSFEKTMRRNCKRGSFTSTSNSIQKLSMAMIARFASFILKGFQVEGKKCKLFFKEKFSIVILKVSLLSFWLKVQISFWTFYSHGNLETFSVDNFVGLDAFKHTKVLADNLSQFEYSNGYWVRNTFSIM